MASAVVHYRKLYKELESRILSGELSGKLPSQSQLIDEFKVSHNTVKKVLDQLKIAGLVTGHQGKGIFVVDNPRSSTAGSIGIWLPYFMHLTIPFYAHAVEAIRNELLRNNFSVEYLSRPEELLNYRGSGVILLDRIPDNIRAEELIKQLNGRLLQLNYNIDRSLPTVSSDNAACGYMAMQQLYCCGHRNIGIITRETYHIGNLFAFRLQGVKDFASEHPDIKFMQQEIDLAPTPHCPSTAADKAAGELLKKMPDITAIFAFTDDISLGVLSALQRQGLKVPDDISIISVDNRDFSHLTNPPLTTFQEDAEAIGQAAARLITASPAAGAGASLQVRPHLIERSSIKNLNL